MSHSRRRRRRRRSAPNHHAPPPRRPTMRRVICYLKFVRASRKLRFWAPQKTICATMTTTTTTRHNSFESYAHARAQMAYTRVSCRRRCRRRRRRVRVSNVIALSRRRLGAFYPLAHICIAATHSAAFLSRLGQLDDTHARMRHANTFTFTTLRQTDGTRVRTHTHVHAADFQRLCIFACAARALYGAR